MLYSHQIIIEVLEGEVIKYLSFSADLDELYISDNYTLELCENKDLVAEISFIGTEKNPEEIERIKNELQNVKKLNNI